MMDPIVTQVLCGLGILLSMVFKKQLREDSQ